MLSNDANLSEGSMDKQFISEYTNVVDVFGLYFRVRC